MIPIKTGFPTLRTSLFAPNNNDNLLEKSLDLVEERRENVLVQLAYYQQKLKQEYDSSVKLRPLAPRDLVLRKVMGTAKKPSMRKVKAQLGKVIPYYLGSRYRGILPRRYRRKMLYRNPRM